MKQSTILFVLTLILLAPASHAAPRIVDVKVNVEDDRQTYALVWTTEPAGAPVSIIVSDSPDSASGREIAFNALDGSFRWRSNTRDQRHYFTLVPADGEPRLAASRLLPLKGGRNFRDLGGYETSDGRRVKWGRVFRSGVMNELTDSDYDFLASLGIRTVCDFRASDERDVEPTEWRAGTIDYVTFPDPEEDRESSPLSVLGQEGVTPEQVSNAMAEGYVGIAYQHASSYRQMFDRLASGEIPLAFNCAAGKDRTGIAAALLLTVLGVPRSTIVSDYGLSDDFVDYKAAFMGEEAWAEAEDRDSPYAFLYAMPPELIEPLMLSDEKYIEAALEGLEREHGSVMSFIQQELDVTDIEIDSIRNALLD